MKIKKTKHWIFILFILLVGCTSEEQAPTLEEAGQEVIRLLQDGEYETIAVDWFSEQLQESLSPEELQRNWENQTVAGDFIEVSSLETESRTEELDLVEAKLAYTTVEFDVRMIFNEQRRLVGFSLSEGIVNMEMPEGIVEEDIIVGEDTDHPLEGILTLPKTRDEKLPAVVLVHGSGPSDRDETTFANKPFRDLAWGLAEKGVAVIRYDKRTFIYGEEFASDRATFTVYEEAVEDAIRATDLAKSDSRIDEKRVFLGGHSLGGMLAPRIDAEGGDYTGLIILAGSPRPLWEIVYDQTLEAIENQITVESEKKKQLTLLDEEYEKAKSLKDVSDEEAGEMNVFGMSGYYLKEMDQLDVPTLISDLDKPLLLLQGEDDFQVYYEKDFEVWQELLKDRSNVTFKSYPGLNHLFMKYEGPAKGTVAEYEVQGQVEASVIEDIGEWIFSLD